ncbi:MAG TPA: AI-2E family transporter YdiK [Myxococcaceae bacterium]|nr:AI-2E family transporter YdiK [Myxococcaceae bacterium]
MATPVNNLPRTLMAIIAISGLLFGTLWVVRPFLGPGIWAVTIVVATWPLFRRLQGWLGGRRGLAVAVMALVLLAIIVVPVWLAVDTVIEQSDRLVALVRSLPTLKVPPPPAWVQSLPLGGPRIARSWTELSQAAPGALSARIEPYVGSVLRWFGNKAGSFGQLLLHFLAMIIIAIVLFARGEVAARGVLLFFRRLAGQQGEASVVLAGQAIRAVAMGVIVTALVQSAVSGLGMVIAGIPRAGLLTAVVFLLCIAQLGPFLVMVPGVVWLYWSGSPGRGTFFLVWTLVVLTMDNVLRPWLITRGANLPILLIFAGVIGGLLSFGVIGLFIGPVILAVSYTLLEAWVREDEPAASAHPSPAPAAGAPPPAA